MFDQYQKSASELFKEHHTLDEHQSRLLDWTTGLGGEAGEVQEVIKHHIWGGEPLDKMVLAKELGDVLWYMAAICTTVDIDLSSIAELNNAKLRHRYNNGAYQDDASQARHESERKFEDTFIYQNMKAKILRTKAPLNVIFVGPDGAGKTTIAKKVAEILAEEGFKYHKCDYRQEDKPNLAKQLLESQTNIIYDRFYYPDEIIYSRVQHEKTSTEPMDWDTDYWKAFNTVLETLDMYNTLYILVDASDEVLEARLAERGDDYIDAADLGKIKALYDRWRQFLQGRPQLIHKMDATDAEIDSLVDEAVMVIRKAQAIFANQAMNTYLPESEESETEEEQKDE